MLNMTRRWLPTWWPRWAGGVAGTPDAHAVAPSRRSSDTAGRATLESAEDRFDNFVRSVASQATRRDALRVSANGAFLSFMATLGLRPAHAAADCLCGRVLYDPAIQCCTVTGVQTKRPIADLERCPERVAPPNFTCGQGNGCGGEGGQPLPENYGAANWRPCCDSHDCAWGTCRSDRNGADAALRDCIRTSCDTAFPVSLVPLPGGFGSYDENRIDRSVCRGYANTGFTAVQSRWGTDFYNNAQRNACDCCGAQSCPTCPGGTCSNLPSCQDPGCVCFQTVEGRGFCHLPQSCAGLARCTSSSSCPSGWACVSVTCCVGSGAICIRPCFTLGGAVSQRSALSVVDVGGQMTAPVTGASSQR